jgi:protein gp37
MNRVKAGSGWEHLLEIARIEGLDSAFTSNPYGGCHGIGCAVRRVCWARRYALKRLKWGSFEPQKRNLREFEEWRQRKKPSVITPVSMGDLFGQKPEHIRKVLENIKACYWHVFAILTKLPQYATRFNPYPENVWFGVTVNRQADVWRLDVLRKVEARKKYCLFEPLYSSIRYPLMWLDLIVIGPQNNPLVQPKREWVESIVKNAGNARIFYKSKLKF